METRTIVQNLGEETVSPKHIGKERCRETIHLTKKIKFWTPRRPILWLTLNNLKLLLNC
jgi:hypothetical protein